MKPASSSFWIFGKPSMVRRFLPDAEIESYYSESELMQFGLKVGKRCEMKGFTFGFVAGAWVALAIQIGFDLWRTA